MLDEKESQIAHGETVRETANMVSFMADVIGIRDDMFIGEGHKYQKTFIDALEEGYRDGILEQRPTLVNLQCDVDHPTQCMADMLHIIHYFGGVENLKGKKVAMTWAYSPQLRQSPCPSRRASSACSPASAWTSRSPIPRAMRSCPRSRRSPRRTRRPPAASFKKCNDMKEAFRDADIVYPKSWAPFKAMEERTKLYQKGDKAGIDALEKEAPRAERRAQGLGLHRRDDEAHEGRQGALSALPARRHLRSFLPRGRGRQLRVRPLHRSLCTSRPPTSPTSSPR